MPFHPRFPPSRRVEILAFPGVQLLDVTGPLQVFATANAVAAVDGGAPPYATGVVGRGQRAGGVTASAGLRISVEKLPSPRRPCDTLIVAGGDGTDSVAGEPEVLRWLGARASRARRVASVCTGAFLLAAVGVLDGRRAATHWKFCDELARRHPTIRVEPDPIFVRDGSLWTSAGITAGIDLALAMVEEDLGPTVALAVARHLVVFLKRPGGQAQFSAALSLQTGDDRFGALHRWIDAHLAGDLSLATLAREAGLSERSFSRHYAAVTGVTPARAVERLRVDAARRLLSGTRTPIKRVAQRCGFGSEETMRRAFDRLLATTPQNYRDRFPGQARGPDRPVRRRRERAA